MTRVAPILALAAALLACGCSSDPSAGYAFTSTYPANVRTVAVPVFDNSSFATGVEIELTEAVIKEFQRATPIAVTRAGLADSELRATVRQAELRSLSNDSVTGLSQTMAYRLTVDFEWRDTRSGKVLAERRGFSTADVFIPARQTGERLEVGQNAAVQRLARDIVSELRAAW